MNAFYLTLKNINGKAEAREYAWDEYVRRCQKAGTQPDRKAFDFGFNAGLVYGCFDPMEEDHAG